MLYSTLILCRVDSHTHKSQEYSQAYASVISGILSLWVNIMAAACIKNNALANKINPLVRNILSYLKIITYSAGLMAKQRKTVE